MHLVPMVLTCARPALVLYFPLKAGAGQEAPDRERRAEHLLAARARIARSVSADRRQNGEGLRG